MRIAPVLPLCYLLIIATVLQSCSSTKTISVESENERIEEKFSVLKSNENIKEGPYELYSYGKKSIVGNYKNNEKDGTWEYFYNGNDVSIIGHYSNGEKHGEWRYFSPPNKFSCVIFYKNGEKDSVWKSYYGDGSLLLETTFNPNSNTRKESIHYSNGKLMKVKHFENGKLDGVYQEYFSNGQLYQEIIYKNGKPFTLVKSFDLSGNPMDFGNLENGNGKLVSHYIPSENEENPTVRSEVNYKNNLPEGEATYYYISGTPKSKGTYEDGEKTGVWTTYNQEGEISSTYDYGELEKNKSEDKPEPSASEEIYTMVEAMPEFPGGESSLIKYIASIQYPAIAKENNIEGSVFVRFVVDQLGSVTDVQVAKGTDQILNNAATGHLENQPRWNPGFQNGIPVKVQYVVPIKFRLE